MKKFNFYAMICAMLFFASCSSSSSSDAQPDIKGNIAGKYWCPDTKGLSTFYFKADGTYEQGVEPDYKTNPISSGTWTLNGSTLALVDKSGSGTNLTITVKNSTSTKVTYSIGGFGDLGYHVCQ